MIKHTATKVFQCTLLLIADVAVTIPPSKIQNVDYFIFFFLTCIWEISKVVCKFTRNCCQVKLEAILSNLHAFVLFVLVCFIQHMDFLVNNFASFMDVGVRKLKIFSSCWWRFVTATSPILMWKRWEIWLCTDDNIWITIT